MAMEMHVLFRGPLPSKAALGRAVKALGFPLTITAKGSLEQRSGFMPMRLQREETGVEFDVTDGRDAVEAFGGKDVEPGLDRVASFRWGGAEDEMLCAMCTAAALARLTNGLVFEEADGQLMSAESAARFAAEHVESVLKPPAEIQPRAKVRGTRPADLKHYLKPLLQQRPDLMLAGRLLVVRPFRHILRGAVFEPSSSKTSFYLSPCLGLLWDLPGLSMRRVHEHLWSTWQPHIGPLLIDVLAEDVFPKIAGITTLAQLASERPRIDTLVLAGDRAGAERLLRAREGRIGISEFAAQRQFLETSIDEICERYRACEAAAVEGLKLGDAWQPAPFPVELPEAERDRCAEAPFPLRPCVDRPDWLLGDLPDKPGDVRFAKTALDRNGGVRLVVPLSREDAEIRHRDKEPYVAAARLPNGPHVVLTDLTGRDRHDPGRGAHDLEAHRELALEFPGSARLVLASFSEDFEVAGPLHLASCDVREADSDDSIWSSDYSDRPTISISDWRNGRCVSMDRLASAAEQKILTAPAPAFGDIDSLVTRTLRWLKIAGYGELIG